MTKAAVFFANFMVITFFLVMASCGLDEDPFSDDGGGQPGPRQVSFDAKVQANPNNYQVNLQWTENPMATGWVVSRAEEAEAKPVQLVTLEKKDLSFVDSKVISGHAYRYALTAIEPSQIRLIREVSVSVPKDFEVAKEISPKDLDVNGVNRLFLRAGAKILTNGEGLHIAVNEIISEGATIVTFNDGQTAGAGSYGRSGGGIYIRAKTGRGILNIVARGENGGDGSAGPQGGPGSKGPKGARGENGYERSGRVGFRATCKKQTEDGGQGGQGFPGGIGGPGAPGGSSCRINVEIEDPTKIQIHPEVIPGVGGKGGPGGPGGPGGAGGDPGDRDKYGKCRVANPGPQGPQGPTGPAGNPGATGEKEPYCLRLGSAVFGKCN